MKTETAVMLEMSTADYLLMFVDISFSLTELVLCN